jgi:hypothetical protein
MSDPAPTVPPLPTKHELRCAAIAELVRELAECGGASDQAEHERLRLASLITFQLRIIIGKEPT